MRNNILFCLIVNSLLLSISIVTCANAGDVVTTIALEDGPSLFGPTQTPDFTPTQDTPDSPVKAAIEGSAETKNEAAKAEDSKTDTPQTEAQKLPASDTSPTTPVDNTTDTSATEEKSKADTPVTTAPVKEKRELSPALVGLRDKVRKTIAAYQKMPFNTRQNSTDEIINYCLALGCNTEISLFDAGGEKRANGITCLCWNYPCGGFEPLMMVDGHISARLGYGAQSRPSQLLAVLALSRVQPTYPMRAGNTVRTVADLVESEKKTCRSGADLSLKLIGLAYYAEDTTWKNDRDEEWSVEKMVKEELTFQPTTTTAALERLMGLSYAISRREKRNLPIDGQFARAKKYINDFHEYALKVQNQDGSWGHFLNGQGVNKDVATGLRSTAYVLEWLALSLPDDRLDDPAIAAGIAYLNNIMSQRYQGNLPALSAQEISGAMHGLHALAIYDERLFKSADGEDIKAEKKPATAKRQGNAGQSR